MSQSASWSPGRHQTAGLQADRMIGALKAAMPQVAFGLRLWVGVSLALGIAFWLQLDNPFWAGVTVAIVFETRLGASLRKARFYMLGTTIGAVAIVALTACFPQDRLGFLAGLALWIAACGFAASMLRNFAAFAAVLSGYTAAIIASGELGPAGGASQTVFTIALTRGSNVFIGIICATIVLSWTDFGGASRRLSAQIAGVSAAVAKGLASALSPTERNPASTLGMQRELLGRIAALGRAIDDAMGESSSLRLRASVLEGAVGGLLAALSGWRAAAQLGERPLDDRQREAAAILRQLPQELKSDDVSIWTVDPQRMRSACADAVRALAALESMAPPLRLATDQTAEALIGIRRAADSLLLLANPARPLPSHASASIYSADWLPALVNAARIFLVIGVIELIWIATAWPTGAFGLTFGSIYVSLLTIRGDQAHSTATDFLIGICLTVVVAATVKFAVLPGLESFSAFALVIGVVLAPAGAMIARGWRPAIFTFITIFFILLLAPENVISYDTVQFYNLALAMFVGLSSAALAFRLLPALSPATRTLRILALASRDLRRLTANPAVWTSNDWKSRMHGRILALPAQVEPSQLADLLKILSFGTEILRLRRISRRLRLQDEMDAALQAMSRGDRPQAIDRLRRLDLALAALSPVGSRTRGALRARGSVLAISEALSRCTSPLTREFA